MKLSLVIPAHNEEKRIGATLAQYSEYFEVLREKKALDYEILVVINNTQDQTETIVRAASEQNTRIRYLNFAQGGKGFAVIEGFLDALKRENDLIGFVDADMATSPSEFYKLVASMGSRDGVIASRWVPGSTVRPKPSVQRKIARTAFNVLIRSLLFLPFRDTQCGAKVFRRHAVEKIVSRITMSQWAFDVDLLYICRREGFTIGEFPTVWVDQEYSKINFWKAGPRMALGIVRLRILTVFPRLVRAYESFFPS